LFTVYTVHYIDIVCIKHVSIEHYVAASQAYVKRVFSVCGTLTTDRRNKMINSLEVRACLDLNHEVPATTGFYRSQWAILFE